MLRNQKGFTLIELLIVVVIIGILAAIALPKFGQTRERAYVSAMQSDLRQLATAQELCYQDNNFTYCDEADMPADMYTTSAGVTVNWTVGNVGGTGQSFTATASHTATAQTCDMDAAGVITCVAGT